MEFNNNQINNTANILNDNSIIDEILIKDIDTSDNVNDFRSDNPSLNNYLNSNAYYEHIMHFANTKVVKISNRVIAYFTMQAKEIQINEEYGDSFCYPLVYLKYLAVDENFQGNGIGTALLQYIILKSEEFSKFVGLRCLLIDALNEKIDWYHDRGFELLDDTSTSNSPTTQMYFDFRNQALIDDYMEV